MSLKFSRSAWRLALTALAIVAWTGSSAKAEESPNPETSTIDPATLLVFSEPLQTGFVEQAYIFSSITWSSLPFDYGIMSVPPAPALPAPGVLNTGSVGYPHASGMTTGSCCFSNFNAGCYVSAGTLSLSGVTLATTTGSITKAGSGVLTLSGVNSQPSAMPATWLTLPTTKSQQVKIDDPSDQKPFLVKTDFTIADSSWSSNMSPRFFAELTQESSLASLKSQLDDGDSLLTAWDFSLNTDNILSYSATLTIGGIGRSFSRLSNVDSASMSILTDADLPSQPLTLWHRQDVNSDWVRLPSAVTYDGQYLNFSANEGLFGTYAITGMGASIPEPASLGLLALVGAMATLRRSRA